jgi:hypothetical protein
MSSLSRRNVAAIGAVVVALFVVANVTAKSAKSPGTLSNVAWGLFLFGAVALVVVGVAALVGSRRSRA